MQQHSALEVDRLQWHTEHLRRRVRLQPLVVAAWEEINDDSLLKATAASAPLPAGGLRAPGVAQALHGSLFIEDHLSHDAEVQDVANLTRLDSTSFALRHGTSGMVMEDSAMFVESTTLHCPASQRWEVEFES